MKRYNKGNMLCITVAVLALLSALSIMFMSTSSVERSVSTVAIQNCNAKLAAEAGLEYAISQLRKDFGGTRPITTISTGSWWYQKQNTTTNNAELFDNAAAEIRLDALHKKQDSITNDVQVLAIPSYCAVENTKNEINDSESTPVDTVPENSPRNISGVCGNTDIKTFNPSIHFPFTLKIVDTTSQFPLNTHVSQNQMNQLMGLKNSSDEYDNNAIEIVAPMLDCLSEEVAKLSAWQAYKPNDKKGPLHGLGRRIIEKRNSQENSEGKCCGFLSKYDIVGKYTKCENASSDEITLEDLSYIWDYITVQPTWKEMAVQNIYRQIAPINGTEEQYRIEYRCPVNINTASYPVLMAVLQGISINNKITIDHNLADNIARNIIAVRSGKKIQNNAMTSTNDSITFKTWTAFNYFIDVLSEIYSSNTTWTDETWGMIKANFNPNVHLKKTNPDLTIYQNVTKPELSKYTTEFCFFPLGYFEITSLGEQYDDKGNILSSYNIGTTAHIYNTLYQTSQYDFEGGTSGYQTVLGSENADNNNVAYNPDNIASRISTVYTKAGNTVQSSNYGTGYNAFTLGNNIYPNSTNSRDLKTLWKNSSKLYGAITPVRYQNTTTSSGNSSYNTDSSGNTLYTGSETLDKNANAYVFQENFSGDSTNLNIKTEAFPSPDAAGVVEHEGASYLFSDGLYLQPNMPVQKYDITESNFPPINNENPLDNKGTILFWFKINNKWYDNQYHTVFLSNQKQADITIQREIKFKVKKPTETDLQHAMSTQTSADDSNISSSTKQFLRKLTIEFVSRVTGDNLEKSNYAYKETKRTVVFDPCETLGIHAHEWYHLAVRWQDSKQETANNPQDNTIIESSINDKSHIVLCGNFYNAQDNLVRNNGSQLGRIYDTETNLVTSDTEKTLVTSTDTEITQNTTDKINGNCFFIGEPCGTLMLYMTIDDFRISALCENTIDDANYFPSRAPYPNPIKLSGENDPPVNCYAVYQGRMKLPNNIPTEQKSGSITSFAWTCYGDSSLRPHYTTYTKEYEDIDFEKAFNEIFKGGKSGIGFNYKAMKNKNIRFENWVTSKIDDDGSSNFYKKQLLTIEPYDSNIYWERSTQSLTSVEKEIMGFLKEKLDKKLADGFNKDFYGDGYAYPRYKYDAPNYKNQNKETFTTCTDPELTTSYEVFNNKTYNLSTLGYPGGYCYHYDDSYGGKLGWRLRYLYDMKFKNIDDLITYYISTWNTAKSHLLQKKERTTIEKFQTYSFVNDCIVPEKANDLPYIFKDEENNKIDSWVYEIVFPASTLESSNNNQVFNNAIIDDVTCFYLLDQPDISDRYAVH